MQVVTPESPTAIAAQTFYETLPDKIQVALRAYADEMDYSIEAVLEMAIASFLDEDAVSFVDCRPLSAMGMNPKS
jgi:hypothetical protein